MPDAVSHLLDKVAIHESIAAFADAATRNDLGQFRELWADDGEWIIDKPIDQRARGHSDLVSMLDGLRGSLHYFVQFASPVSVVVDGDEATARSICHEAAKGPDNRAYRNDAFFIDRLQRSGNRWIFTRRRYRYLWVDMTPFGGDAVPLDPADDGAVG